LGISLTKLLSWHKALRHSSVDLSGPPANSSDKASALPETQHQEAPFSSRETLSPTTTRFSHSSPFARISSRLIYHLPTSFARYFFINTLQLISSAFPSAIIPYQNVYRQISAPRSTPTTAFCCSIPIGTRLHNIFELEVIRTLAQCPS
jgi:hypothetical protein